MNDNDADKKIKDEAALQQVKDLMTELYKQPTMFSNKVFLSNMGGAFRLSMCEELPDTHEPIKCRAAFIVSEQVLRGLTQLLNESLAKIDHARSAVVTETIQ